MTEVFKFGSFVMCTLNQRKSTFTGIILRTLNELQTLLHGLSILLRNVWRNWPGCKGLPLQHPYHFITQVHQNLPEPSPHHRNMIRGGVWTKTESWNKTPRWDHANAVTIQKILDLIFIWVLSPLLTRRTPKAQSLQVPRKAYTKALNPGF